MPRTWPRTVETYIPVLGVAGIELLPVPGRVSLTAVTMAWRSPGLTLAPDDCIMLARELLHAAAEAHVLSGACEELPQLRSATEILDREGLP